MDTDELRRVLVSAGLLQELAAVEHERWSHWQQYMHEQGHRQPDGSLTLPAELVSRWDKQIQTAYSDLSPAEQKSDQEQVQRYLPVLIRALTRPE
jgi:hypothetical protein